MIPDARPIRVGVIADTHRLVRPEALAGLAGSELIVHAGDVGDVGGPEVLDALRAVPPVVAVRGNNDRGPWAHALAKTAIVDGHSHRPRWDNRAQTFRPRQGTLTPHRNTAATRVRLATSARGVPIEHQEVGVLAGLDGADVGLPAHEPRGVLGVERAGVAPEPRAGGRAKACLGALGLVLILWLLLLTHRL